jgi:hypothetical protein
VRLEGIWVKVQGNDYFILGMMLEEIKMSEVV